jgi:uncharacterized membrane protein YfhO
VVTPEPAGFAARLDVEEERADRLRVRAELSHPGWLVRVASYDRGWRARVDGTPALLLRGNFAFQAVPVPAGRHTVELRYLPASVVWGGTVSLATGLVLFGWAAGRRWRRPGA